MYANILNYTHTHIHKYPLSWFRWYYNIYIYIDICITYQRLPNHRLSTLCSWLQELRDCIFMGFVTKFEALRHRKNRFRFAAWLPFTSKVGLCFTLGVGNAGAICVHLIHLVSFCFCIALSCWDVLLSRQDYTEGGFTRGWFRIQCMEPSDSECMGQNFLVPGVMSEPSSVNYISTVQDFQDMESVNETVLCMPQHREETQCMLKGPQPWKMLGELSLWLRGCPRFPGEAAIQHHLLCASLRILQKSGSQVLRHPLDTSFCNARICRRICQVGGTQGRELCWCNKHYRSVGSRSTLERLELCESPSSRLCIDRPFNARFFSNSSSVEQGNMWAGTFKSAAWWTQPEFHSHPGWCLNPSSLADLQNLNDFFEMVWKIHPQCFWPTASFNTL